MQLLTGLFDSLLGLCLLWLAWRALASPNLFKAVVLFVAFGLLMSLAWVRLDAPDVALAEAAIGAGLTGALLLAALARLDSTNAAEPADLSSAKTHLSPQSLPWLPFSALLLVTLGLGYTVTTLPTEFIGLSSEVSTQLANSGVANPVTAVLLNFRGYDTLLEMTVLLIALLGVWSLGGIAKHHDPFPGTVLDTLSRLLTPVLILVAAYLLWVGSHAPGGAFQAGSILGAAGVLLLLSGWQLQTKMSALLARLILLAGPVAFISMAAVTLIFEGQLLEYPPAQAGVLILLLETVATLSIGATLAALFLGGHPWKNNEEST
ncbi:MAG: DUF4040 domain-containing protein [Gammaproteobacteria bacterium]|nr:DUF4040 domain-containing protein [Gammaproteobacteria bacterium]